MKKVKNSFNTMASFIFVMLLGAMTLAAVAHFSGWINAGGEDEINEPIETTHYEGRLKRYGMTYEHEITYHIFDTHHDGKNVVILAGIHGNEPAGWLAALYMVENFNFSNGRFLIIPKANPLAIYNHIRTVNGLDLNRHFPGNLYGNIAYQIAAAIVGLIEEFDPCIIIDLHEAMLSDGTWHSGTLPNSIGHSYMDGTLDAARFAVQAINASEFSNPQRAFRVLSGNVTAGTVRRELASYFNVPVFLIETARPSDTTGMPYNPLSLRARQQVFLVRSLLYFYGIYYGG
ncbi:MAG: succinylglutamate desuccinylase/aspartoacylase family protein [Firmicutes bacterium]|nr:succinylglutamate desuccinylase/aspartoacylase family protein [Bacillota bacterium]